MGKVHPPEKKEGRREVKLHYVLQLWEPAAPAFCSFSKVYVGTKPELLKVAERLEQEQNMPETSAAIREYYAGNHKATHNVAYQEIPVLTPVRVLGESKLGLPEREWEHMNAWEWPYKMRFASAQVSQIVIRFGGNYHRCLKATTTDLCYEGFQGEWKPIGSILFGNACVLHSEELPDGHFEFGNDLYVQEESSKTKEPLVRKLMDPEEVVFDRLCDEIFGDG